ncbi:hypothetical protein [Helicobacter apodemus]|uniref:Uncharacterized protein n=1 Tax=Helicobacter apodemus TaxID=135569 RepID=A0A2U8FEL4_9HELI|nr:hypothetical protein [Helicobacter apodemus]AWI33865.1 hypothetical protein CDV25_03125 [Helicobacter apodemus]
MQLKTSIIIIKWLEMIKFFDGFLSKAKKDTITITLPESLKSNEFAKPKNHIKLSIFLSLKSRSLSLFNPNTLINTEILTFRINTRTHNYT